MTDITDNKNVTDNPINATYV